MNNDVESVLISEEQLKDKVAELGRKISEEYKGKNLMLVSVLKGSCVFLADLMRKITIPLTIDFMCLSSYGSGSESNGRVKIVKDLDVDIKGYDLLFVEDILDSGVTLSNVLDMFKKRNPASISLCALLSKPERRKVEIDLDYCGFIVPDEFVVGYGLDYDEKYRNLPYIGILKKEVYQK